MKVTDVKTHGDMITYIGKSKSWKKAWHASKKKWLLLKEGKFDNPASGKCGFCLVQINKDGLSAALLGLCGNCPVCEYCTGLKETGFKCSPEEILKYLEDNKERIFALD